jgi:hypothetical protein
MLVYLEHFSLMDVESSMEMSGKANCGPWMSGPTLDPNG